VLLSEKGGRYGYGMDDICHSGDSLLGLVRLVLESNEKGDM
jgi:hypothetical protein